MAEERIGGSFSIDITKLKAGLTQANRLIRESHSEFKAAAAGMDDWSNSQEGLEASIKNLNTVQELQKKKLEALKKAYEEAGYGSDDLSAAAVKLRTDINNEQAALNKTEKELEEQKTALDNMKNSSDDTMTASQKLKKTIEDQETELAALKTKYTDVVLEMGKSSDEAEDLADDIRDLSGDLEKNKEKLSEAESGFEEMGDAAEEASGDFTVAKGALADLVADGIEKAIDSAKKFAGEMITTAASIKAETSQYDQAFGEMAGSADKIIGQVSKSTGIVETRLKGTAVNIYSFARSSGASTEEAMELMEEALYATADSAAYYDRSLSDTAESLQSFLKGNYANDAALGVSATEFTRDAKAAELFGTKFINLSEIEKQKTLLKMVTDAQKLSGAMGQASRESDGFENVIGNASETWRQFKGKMGTSALEAVIPVVQDITKEFDKFTKGKKAEKFANGLGNITKKVLPPLSKAVMFAMENIDTLAKVTYVGVTAFTSFNAVMKVSSTITATTKAIKGLEAGVGLVTKAQTAWNAVMEANPIGAVITAVGLLATGIGILIASTDDATASNDRLSESQKEIIEKANDSAEAFRETKDAADEEAGAYMDNVDYIEYTLLPELESLIDENGKVKDSDQARADFIIQELNEALGTEYEKLEDIIDQNGKIKDSIYDVIDARKAQILLEVYEESYREAIEKTSEAEQARTIYAEALGEVETELAQYRKEAIGYADQETQALNDNNAALAASINGQKEAAQANVDRLEKELAEKQALYNDANNVLHEYYTTIDNYEKASTAVKAGESKKAVGYLQDMGNGFMTVASTAKLGAEEQKKVLKQQVIDLETHARIMKDEYERGVEGVTEAMVSTAEQQADRAITEYNAIGGNITKGISDGARSEQWVFEYTMKELIESGLRAAKNAAQIHSPSRLFRDAVGKNMGLGVAVGVTDATPDVNASVKSLINDATTKIDAGAISANFAANIQHMPMFGTKNEKNSPSGGVTINQTYHYSAPHSQYELYKSKQQTIAAVRLAMGRL